MRKGSKDSKGPFGLIESTTKTEGQQKILPLLDDIEIFLRKDRRALQIRAWQTSVIGNENRMDENERTSMSCLHATGFLCPSLSGDIRRMTLHLANCALGMRGVGFVYEVESATERAAYFQGFRIICSAY